MKRILILLTSLLIGSLFLFSQSSYRFQHRDIKLEIDTALYFIQTDSRTSKELIDTELNKGLRSKKIDSYDKISNNQFLITSRSRDIDTIGYFSNVYLNEQKSKIIILPRIVVMLKQGEGIEDILKTYAEELSAETGGKQRWILKCHLNKSEDVLKITNEIYNRKEVDWCEPELFFELRFYNTLYPQQYYLHNTGQNGGTVGIDINVEPAWEITNGSSNITVAVLDQGVEEHEDLADRVLDGYTIGNPTGLGRPQNENALSEKGHGQACAGIIAASNNAIGIRGVASNVQILPVNIAPYTAYLDYWGNRIEFGSNIEIAEAMNWAWKRADVLSNSWGGGNYSNDIVSAIDSARVYGRNGKGSIVVFSSGNFHPDVSDVSFPGNVNGVITVGAINNKGEIWNYSQRGASMDLVAPSGNTNLNGDIRTIDRMGSLGYNNGNYMNNFGGTSAACPQVAGVAALMLSVNPDLTETQIRTTLQNTARDLGTPGFDNTYGYGLVDAFAAVHAVAPRLSGPSLICDQATYTVNNLPQGATVQWSVNTTNLTVISQGNNSITYGKRAGNYQNEYDVRITAKITLPDGNNVYLYSDVVLWNTEIDEDREYMQVEGLLYKSGGIISLIYPMEGITDYEWVINTKDWVVLNASESRVELGGGHFLGYFTLTYKFKGPCDNEYREITQTFYVCENPPECYWEIEGAFLFTLYPNPATSIVTIELQESARGETTKTQRNSGIFKSKEYEVQLWSTSQMLRTYRTSDEKFQLSVNRLPARIYFVRVIKDGKTYTQKLIKK